MDGIDGIPRSCREEDCATGAIFVAGVPGVPEPRDRPGTPIPVGRLPASGRDPLQVNLSRPKIRQITTNSKEGLSHCHTVTRGALVAHDSRVRVRVLDQLENHSCNKEPVPIRRDHRTFCCSGHVGCELNELLRGALGGGGVLG
jgi:hypothetical protein